MISLQTVALSNLNMRVDILRPGTSFVVGLADSDCSAQILSMLLDKQSRHLRGTQPDLVEVNMDFFYACFGSAAKTRAFGWNGRALTSSAKVPRADRVNGEILTFGVEDEELYLKIPGKRFQASARLGDKVKFRERFYYGIAIVQGYDPPEATIELTPYCNANEKAR